MPIEIPEDWPAPGWTEATPLAHLDTVATDPASGMPGFTPTRWQVASWSTTREIAASSLPGQVRAKTGLSVGTGKALIKRDPDDFPWKKRAVYELTGQAAQLLIAPENCTKVPTGQFQVAEISGDISTLGVQVDLDERTIEGRDKAANVSGWSWLDVVSQSDDTLNVDPSWWISELAKQIGYGTGATPGQDGYTPILDVPMQGSYLAAHPRGVEFFAATDLTWGQLDGGLIAMQQISAPSAAEIRYKLKQMIVSSVIITVDVRDTFRFLWASDTTQGQVWFEVTSRAGFGDWLSETSSLRRQVDLTVRSRGTTGTTNTATTTTFDLPLVDDRPEGIQVQFEVLSADGINWTGARARVARSATAPWSAWVTHTATSSFGTVQGAEAETYEAWLSALPKNEVGGEVELSRFARFTMVDTAISGTAPNRPIDLWNNTSGPNGRLYLEPLLGTITSPWLSSDLTTWNAMQEVTEAWQGALITDVYGDLHLMNRLSLAGVGTGTEIPIDVGLKFEDLPWIANHTDQADRLVVRYRPARAVAVDGAIETRLPVVWEAEEIIAAPPGTSEVFVNTDYLYLMYSNFPWYRKDASNNVYNEWDGWTNSNGTGSHIVQDTQIHIGMDQVTTSTWKIRITNFTNAPFYMVDSSGTPWLKIRSYYHMDQTQEAVIERGVTSTEAKNPLTIDLSNYVQNETDANALADYIWGRVNHRAWRADTVNMIPDYRLDLGDVVEIKHERTGVLSNALVTKVALDGQPGNVTQKVDLVLIPKTWEDFDEAWATYAPNPPGSWAEFDALWDEYTWEDFDRSPAATTVAQIEEVG